MSQPWQAPHYGHELTRRGRPTEEIAAPLRCACGRRVAPDMLLDCRPARAAGVPGVDRDWVCDACRERWWHSKRVDRVAFYRALGAPLAVLDRLTGKPDRGP